MNLLFTEMDLSTMFGALVPFGAILIELFGKQYSFCGSCVVVWEELQDRSEHWMQLIESLAARVSLCWTPMPPPPVTARELRSGLFPHLSPLLGWLVPGRGLHPFLLTGGGPLSSRRAHHQLTAPPLPCSRARYHTSATLLRRLTWHWLPILFWFKILVFTYRPLNRQARLFIPSSIKHSDNQLQAQIQ